MTVQVHKSLKSHSHIPVGRKKQVDFDMWMEKFIVKLICRHQLRVAYLGDLAGTFEEYCVNVFNHDRAAIEPHLN